MKPNLPAGITFDTLRDYAECGVDFISVGALTHSSERTGHELQSVLIYFTTEDTEYTEDLNLLYRKNFLSLFLCDSVSSVVNPFNFF